MGSISIETAFPNPDSVMVDMELTHDDVMKLLEIIDNAEHLDEFDLVLGGLRLQLQRSSMGVTIARTPASGTIAASRPKHAPSPGALPAGSPAPVSSPAEITIRAPVLGTFYRAPSPDQPPFADVGQRVSADDTICLIKVMKQFSPIRAGIDGVVTSIFAEDGSLVEYDQTLMVIAPVAESRPL